jgi:hypothetical protein
MRNQVSTVLGGGGGRPNYVVHGQFGKSAKQQVVLDLFHKMKFRTNVAEISLQHDAQHFLKHNVRATTFDDSVYMSDIDD